MKLVSTIIFLIFSLFGFAQVPVLKAPVRVNEQSRYNSDSRVFYVWDEAKKVYAPRDAEYETSIIDIREIDTKKNGYAIISLTDDGKTRAYHGSIIAYSEDEEGNPTWVLRSKTARGKVVLNANKKTITYSFESNEERYLKIFVFYLSMDNGEVIN